MWLLIVVFLVLGICRSAQHLQVQAGGAGAVRGCKRCPAMGAGDPGTAHHNQALKESQGKDCKDKSSPV